MRKNVTCALGFSAKVKGKYINIEGADDYANFDEYSGLWVHTDCWKFCKRFLGIELKFGMFQNENLQYYTERQCKVLPQNIQVL